MTPFQFLATLFFGLAILHTFLTPSIFVWAQAIAHKKHEDEGLAKWRHFSSEVLLLLSEVEVVFGIWLIPLLICFVSLEGKEAMLDYLNSRSYTHAIYITVIVVVIGSKPILHFAERVLHFFASLGKDSPAAWWFTLLIVGPLLGALLKEVGAMVLCALLLSKKFFAYNPSKAFSYATLGLLFGSVSIGGMLTSFSSRALFIVSSEWGWDTGYMLVHFGWKVVLGITLATTIYYFIFRKQFAHFPKKIEPKKEANPPPLWITFIHLLFLAGIILTTVSAPLFIGIFIIFLGFWKATTFYQGALHLKSAILVGFFFASLLIHGELQGWWVSPLMEDLTDLGALCTSFVLSGFMDNAIVSYLTLDISSFDDMKHYLIVGGAMSAGGLTIIANAPNPAGHAILRESFKGKISFLYLFLGALFPSLLFLSFFWFFR